MVRYADGRRQEAAIKGFIRAQDLLLRTLLPLGIGLSAVPGMAQDCGWSRIDHRVAYDDSGAWNPDVCRNVASAFTIAQVGAALWQGAESRFGRTLWKGVDAQIFANVTASIGKHIFTRARAKEDKFKPTPTPDRAANALSDTRRNGRRGRRMVGYRPGIEHRLARRVGLGEGPS